MSFPSVTHLVFLVSLQDGPKTGRQVGRRFTALSRCAMPYGSLYTTLSRLKDTGLVSVAPAPDNDARSCLYSLTKKGAKAIVEARRFFCDLFDILDVH